jgi:hypothetical protein
MITNKKPKMTAWIRPGAHRNVSQTAFFFLLSIAVLSFSNTVNASGILFTRKASSPQAITD